MKIERAVKTVSVEMVAAPDPDGKQAVNPRGEPLWVPVPIPLEDLKPWSPSAEKDMVWILRAGVDPCAAEGFLPDYMAAYPVDYEVRDGLLHLTGQGWTPTLRELFVYFLEEAPMKIYVAGPSRITEECAALIQTLQNAGFEITCDWTKEVLQRREQGITSCRQLEHFEKRDIAHTDIDAVKAADLVVVIHDPAVYQEGSWLEMGAALALDKPVIAWNRGGMSHELSLWFYHDSLRGIVNSVPSMVLGEDRCPEDRDARQRILELVIQRKRNTENPQLGKAGVIRKLDEGDRLLADGLTTP